MKLKPNLKPNTYNIELYQDKVTEEHSPRRQCARSSIHSVGFALRSFTPGSAIYLAGIFCFTSESRKEQREENAQRRRMRCRAAKAPSPGESFWCYLLAIKGSEYIGGQS